LISGLLGACGGAEGPGEARPGSLEVPVPDASVPGPATDWRELQRERYPELVDELVKLERRVERRPEVAALRSKLGRLTFQLGQSELAREHLAAALELDPAHYQAHYNLGVLEMSQGDFEAAARSFLSCVGEAPGFPAAHRDLGLAQLELGREARALASFQVCLELDPTDAECAYRQGQLQSDADPERARASMALALELDPYHLGAASALARLERAAGRDDEAQRWQDRHARLSLLSDLGLLGEPTSLRRYCVEAEYYRKHGRLEAALETCREGLERYPDSSTLSDLHAAVATGSELSGGAE